MILNLNDCSPEAVANFSAAIKNYHDKQLISATSPPVLFIELTQNCNSRCSFCRPRWKNKTKYNMSWEIFNILVKDYIPFAAVVDLRGWGESLLLPDFPDYVSKVAAFGPNIMLTTNLGCDSPRALQSLIDYNVFITISLDCADQHLYEKIRRGVKYDRVIKNLQYITREMDKKNTLKDHLRLAVRPLQRANLKYLPAVIELAAKYGIKEISIGELDSRFYHPGLLIYHQRQTMQILTETAILAKQKGINLILGSAPFKKLSIKNRIFDRCGHPWLYFFVNYLGEVLFCDHLIHPVYHRFQTGHISEKKEILWNGPRARNFRKIHLNKKLSLLPRMCKRCLTLGRYADHEHELDPYFNKYLVTEKELSEISPV
jgi:radical SAM protein with 4Fe4S-binding SPASM domain